MVKKGLRIVPDHDQLLAELNSIIREDMGICKSHLENGDLESASKAIEPWYDYLDKKRRDLSASLAPDLLAALYLNHGGLLFNEGKIQEAAADFRKGLNYASNKVELHRALIDTLFAAGDFNEAILALNQAIKINPEFASYWEGIGDSLFSDGQYADAVLAYEQGFVRQPEHINLLKKMGDCYRENGQLEAARAAYEQVKSKITEMAAVNGSIQ
ncbi:MAG: tetratricopeptide repeat protein [Deltaproteobacteria bacterium]|nr:tetratricopeptide repeat protein [Deltaproteobacteria bacterium]